MANTNNKNIAIKNTDLQVTNLRLTKKGQYAVIQYSTDNGLNYYNLEDAETWINLYSTSFDDVDGDGTSDDVLGNLERIKQEISDIEEAGIAPLADVEMLKSQVANILNEINSIGEISDEYILSLFEEE